MNPHGTAINNTLNQVSGAIGSALLVSVMTSRTKVHIDELGPQGIIQATVEGINDAFFIATFIAAVALVLAFFVKRPKRADEPVQSQESQNLSH